jgi:hypothetical protein
MAEFYPAFKKQVVPIGSIGKRERTPRICQEACTPSVLTPDTQRALGKLHSHSDKISASRTHSCIRKTNTV